MCNMICIWFLLSSQLNFNAYDCSLLVYKTFYIQTKNFVWKLSGSAEMQIEMFTLGKKISFLQNCVWK